MTLPASGNSISLSQVNTELGYSSTAAISMNDAAVRSLFGAGGSGTAISMSQGFGKSNQFAFTITSGQTNANLRTLAVNAGWNGTAKVIATIGSGVYIYSTSTGTPALVVDGSFPNGVSLINNGTILGKGGAGGKGGYSSGGNVAPVAGGSGGIALNVGVAISIDNTSGRIAGGGGGGSGAGFITRYYGKGQQTQLAGSSGGGGIGNGAGGVAASAGGFTSNAGGDGSLTSAGSGGAAKVDSINSGQYNLAGAAGGSYGAAGGTAAGGNQTAASGGAAGAAVLGNANITWVAIGTRNGGIG